ncbi:hypothetical protein Slin14017_G014360 [Septoria linicola]|nr:hypothetical protein Slin14017_G014360 [Septoria linicola]
MDTYKTYNAASSAYLALQAVPLLVTPKLIINMLASEPRLITDVESYMLRALGFALLTLSAFTLLLSGLLPVAPPSASASDESGSENPYAYPTAVTSTVYHALSAFYLYTQITRGFSFGYGSGMLASSALFCVGVFCCLFGNERSRVSKSTGADKRTSNFPFTNTESAREKKKDSKRKSVSSKFR